MKPSVKDGLTKLRHRVPARSWERRHRHLLARRNGTDAGAEISVSVGGGAIMIPVKQQPVLELVAELENRSWKAWSC